MQHDPAEQELEKRIDALLNTGLPVARPSDVWQTFTVYSSDAYRLSGSDIRRLEDQVRAAMNRLTCTGIEDQHVGGALYVLTMMFSAAISAEAAREHGLFDNYDPCHNLTEIARLLPERLRKIPQENRGAWLARLHEDCVMLPTDGKPGFSNPMAYIASMASILARNDYKLE